MMLLLIAYRNIWRNPVRSLVVIGSMVLGIWGGTFIVGFFSGMTQQQLEDMLRQEVSHIQVHGAGFIDQFDAADTLAATAELEALLEADPRVEAFSARLVGVGLIASARLTTGGMVVGVDPEAETAVTQLGDRIVEGELFTAGRPNQVVIGSRLAERLRVGVKNKVVLTLPNREGEMVSAALRVSGIYRERAAAKAGARVYVPVQDLAALLGVGAARHEVAVFAGDLADVPALAEELEEGFGRDLVRPWNAISPELRLISESYDQYVLIIIAIILLALLFGIVNTMLMAVLERTRELGVLMAVGLTRGKVFAMILLETVMIGSIGGPVGLLVAWGTIEWTGVQGIDLSRYAESLESYGLATRVFPTLDAAGYLEILVMVVVASLLAALFPALHAIRLKPMEAIRS
jgi:putative ABC transport system permease protein